MGRFSILVVGLLAGVLGLGLARLAVLPPDEPVHFHANWALWIDGERVDFSADRYMEDVAACAMDPSSITPRARVHMHENNPDVVHVHDSGVSWGHLLQNLGWGIGADWLVNDWKEIFANGDGRQLTFIVNGLPAPPAADRMIHRGDRLLISFGDEPLDMLISERFPTVASTAPEYDEGWDPGGCAGHEHETFGDRIRRAFWF